MDMWMDVDTALAEVPVNIMPLLDATDFKTIEDAVAYDAAGMALFWHFVTTAGAYTVTAVTPTTAGTYDWTDQGAAGIYTIEIPASGGASINNDTEGFGWFTGSATGVLPWRGPVIGFRAAALNDALIDSAWSTTRGLAGTALPNAAADAAGGLAISDAGGLDLDSKLANTNEVTAARMGALTDWINGGRLDLLLDAIKAVTDLLPNAGALTSVAQDATVAKAATVATAANLATAQTAITAIKAVTDVIPNAGALTDLKADTAAILLDTGTDGVVVAAASKTGYRLSATGVDDVLDEVVLGSYTMRQLLRGLSAALVGKLSGAATTTVTIRSADDTKDVVVATVDADGNRSAVTLDLA